MPWIKFLEEPTYCGSHMVTAFKNGDPIEIPILENINNPATNELFDPPAVKPHKLTHEWKPGDNGWLLAIYNMEHIYYKFEIIESPFPDSLNEPNQSEIIN